MQKTVLLLVATLAIASAFPILVEDEKGQQYYLSPVLSRQRREGPQGFGQGGATGKIQSGSAGFANPNGSGASVGYGHAAEGYGHDVSVDGRVPVWSSKNRLGESTLNVGGGASQHVGGFGGTHSTDKRVGVDFNHRF